MLTNNDVGIIDSLLQKRISENNSELENRLEKRISGNNSELEKRFEKGMRDGFTEFFETVIEPYLENERNENIKQHEKTREQIQLLTEHIKDHEKRIRKLEVKSGL